MYTIISPSITLISGKEIKLDTSKYEEYLSSTDEYVALENEFNSINNDLIKNTYKTEIEKQMKKDIENLGFTANKISFELNIDTGKISNLTLEIDKENVSKKDSSNNIAINKIEVGNISKKENYNNLSRQEIENIKNKFKENYGVQFEDMTVNSI